MNGNVPESRTVSYLSSVKLGVLIKIAKFIVIAQNAVACAQELLESVLKHALFLSYCFIFFHKLIVCNKLCIFLVRYFV